MNKRMGTLAVLLTFVLATCAVTISDDSEAEETYTKVGSTWYDATSVEAFTFPESQGIPVVKALSKATKEIDISIYFLSSKNVLALLCDLIETDEDHNGVPDVKVNILIDGTPLGVSSDMEMLKKMDDMGADVKLINYKGCAAKDCEYDYLHNKYAIIDDKTVIITTENWTQTNFSKNTSNRGWGAIVDSTGYAAYMKNIFLGNFNDSRVDVKNIEDALPDLKASTEDYTYVVPTGTVPTKTVTNVKVSPVHSPENSSAMMKEFMNTSTSRLYVEELDIDKTFADYKGDTPIGWMTKRAEAGVEVKYVLDISYEKAKNPEHSQLIYDLNHNTKVDAAPIKGGQKFSVTHNKGLIGDNRAWVGSVNMTKNSFEDDRETAVIIYSKDIADWFAGYFMTDFNNNYDENYEPGYTMVDQVKEEIEENPWYIAVIAVIIVVIGAIIRATIKGAAKGGKKGAKKAAQRATKSGAKKVVKSVIKETSKKKK